jgi:hypothetical protein
MAFSRGLSAQNYADSSPYPQKITLEKAVGTNCDNSGVTGRRSPITKSWSR